MSIFRAELETRHFSFECYASTEKRVRALMRRAWNIHRNEYGKDRVLPFAEFEDDVVVYEIRLGASYRDREPLHNIGSRS